MDNRGFLLISIVLLGFLGWSYFFPPADRKAPAPRTEAAVAATSPQAPEASAAPAVPTKTITITTPKYTAVLDEQGGRLAHFQLSHYSKRKLSPELPDEPMELVTPPNPEDRSLRLTLSDADAPQLADAPFIADVYSLTVGEGETKQLTMTYTDPGGLEVKRIFTFSGDTYLVRQKVEFKNLGSVQLDGSATMRINTAPLASKPSRYDEMGAFINNKLVVDSAEDAAEKLAGYNGKLTRADWIGYMDQYFLTALVLPDTSENPDAVLPGLTAVYQDHGGLAAGVSYKLALPTGKKAVVDFDFYFGPKSNEDLKAAGHNLIKSVDLGWFSFLATPLAALLRWIYAGVGNYGLAIIIVTVLIKIGLWPLTAKSYRSMKDMQKLQPKVTKLREKYADDKETMQREIMQLYKTFKINPLGGCLPMLLQIPFFIAFYRVLDSLLELRGAPFALWIQDLAAPDRLFSFNFTIPFFEPPTGIPVLTLLMGASMLLQQKMTPNTMGDPMQAKMMMMMPVVFTFILINMPAGLVLYWLVNNILSIGQQMIINRPAPPQQAVVVQDKKKS